MKITTEHQEMRVAFGRGGSMVATMLLDRDLRVLDREGARSPLEAFQRAAEVLACPTGDWVLHPWSHFVSGYLVWLARAQRGDRVGLFDAIDEAGDPSLIVIEPEPHELVPVDAEGKADPGILPV